MVECRIGKSFTDLNLSGKWLIKVRKLKLGKILSNPNRRNMADSLWHEDEVRVEKTSNIYFDIEQ